MEKCFIIPMTEPPYSSDNPQRPKYVEEMGISWSGMPIFSKGTYVIKANSTPIKLAELQSQQGVVDFPNIDTDKLDSLPQSRKTKDGQIRQLLGIPSKKGEIVKDFINRAANSEFGHGWNKDFVFAA